VEGSEECDVPGQTGGYSTTIAGRQCTADCQFAPYCGDGVLQTQFDEECDDGANNDGDFCTADCKIVPAGSGGGGSSGGGSSSSGGSDVELGDTQISITGFAYPRTRLNIILDAENVGTVRTGSDGSFEFLTDASPGTATLGVWAEDSAGVRSVTFNTTFDVTQGAITNVNDLYLPPTLTVDDQTVDPGDVVTISGEALPEETVELEVGSDGVTQTTTVDEEGQWEMEFDTTDLSPAEYTLRAKSLVGSESLTTDSGYSRAVQLFVGVDGSTSTPSDLNRDGSINLTDFSILIFWWQTDGGDSDPPADINGDGVVSLADFSILLFNWTG
jgi:cysteine-rich repeat protein